MDKAGTDGGIETESCGIGCGGGTAESFCKEGAGEEGC